jgi:hypothetical protein
LLVKINAVLFPPDGDGNKQVSCHEVDIDGIIVEQIFKNDIEQDKIAFIVEIDLLIMKDEEGSEEHADELDKLPVG